MLINKKENKMKLNELKNKLTEANITTFNTENGFDVDINSKKKFLNLIAKLGNHDWIIRNTNGISYFTDSRYSTDERYSNTNCSTHAMIKTIQTIDIYDMNNNGLMIELGTMDKNGKCNEISFYLNK